ncbi:acyltransferase family protein [Glaciimonas immobilis]|uniref:Peptidoglycan/LPS O-acetylase OafA/YrhL n=1 Tax=Glaciimonas immobilis TaxID=728004 RepID=A0A840RYR9_9BURK|nr:acyltransferase [Glaciimonas immobilis]KAF3998378.1 acyltransferase [Glaciimonas immobilis]MBB5202006.1 peptidoglycan/LPS O-acetylase OafA/YrhL [Glaciimonas immobilis]
MTNAKINEITGLRGIAALLVVYGHSVSRFALPLNINFSGEIGVTIFFCLSGFLMAYLYVGKKFSAPDVIDYAISRFSRIAPAYLFILLISYVVYTNFDPNFTYDISSKNILRHILFSGNVSVFWSITPEVEFYFMFVLIWAAASRCLVRFDVFGIMFLILGCMVLLSYRDVFPGTFIGAKLHYFVFGVIAGALRSRIKEDQGSKATTALHVTLLSLVVLMESGWIPLPFANNKEFYSSILTAAFGAFLVFSFTFPSLIGKLMLGNGFVVFCGECSFSIYLLHMPVVYLYQKFLPDPGTDLVAILLQIIFFVSFISMVLLVSWLNFQMVEKPGARLIKSLGNNLKEKILPLFSLASTPQPVSFKGSNKT